MSASESPKKQFRNLLKAAVVFFVIFVFFGVIYFSGILKPLTSGFVNHSINTMQKEGDRQANQPRIVVMKTGERFECKRVLDGGSLQTWGFVDKDGRAHSVKKSEVQEILMPDGSAAVSN